MMRRVNIFLIVYSYASIVCPQILFECNFDGSTITNNCFTNYVIVNTNLGNINRDPPVAPQSDVTSILKPTENGELCDLPYKVDSYTWDMYFCNNGYCSTPTSQKSKCISGQFGHVPLTTTSVYSAVLKTEAGGINGINEQCIIYYYYLPPISHAQMSIKIRKVEKDSTSEIIDSITSNPLNRWTQRKIDFHARQSGYQIYFDFQRISSIAPLFGIDEILIHSGRCSNESVIESTTKESSPTTSSTSTTTSKSIPIEILTYTTTKYAGLVSTQTNMPIEISSIPTTAIARPNTTLTTSKATEISIPIETSTTTQVANTQSNTTKISTSKPTPVTSGSFNDQGNTTPFNKTLIIVLSTVLSTVLGVSIVAGILIKKKAAGHVVPQNNAGSLAPKAKGKKALIELSDRSKTGIF